MCKIFACAFSRINHVAIEVVHQTVKERYKVYATLVSLPVFKSLKFAATLNVPGAN